MIPAGAEDPESQDFLLRVNEQRGTVSVENVKLGRYKPEADSHSPTAWGQ